MAITRLTIETELRETFQMTISPNNSHIRAAKFSTTMNVTVQSTKKGLVTSSTAMAAIMRFLTVSLDVMAYCSKYMKSRLIGKASSSDFSVISSRSVSIAFFWMVEVLVLFINPKMREASSLVPSVVNFKS